jgi:hypothetical protein
MRKKSNPEVAQAGKHHKATRIVGRRLDRDWPSNSDAENHWQKCEREALSLAGDAHEAAELAFIAGVADTRAWK